MHNLIRFLIIVLISIFYSALIFHFYYKDEKKDYGKVLGVNEAVAHNVIKDKNDLQIDKKNLNKQARKEELDKESIIVYGFPESAYKNMAPQKKGDVDFQITSPIAIVIDEKSNSILFQKNIQDIAPIASITKIVTALVLLDLDLDWNEVYKITDSDRVNGGKIFLYKGDEVTIKDLFYLSLVASANTATKALVNSTGFTEKEFVDRMNSKMENLGFFNTHFSDPVGFSNQNKSNAIELAQIFKIAFSKNEIRTVLSKEDYTFETKQGKIKKAYSTNELLIKKDVKNKNLGGKTGYTETANYCFVGEFINKDGNKLISVLLGGPEIYSRFDETVEIVDWVYKNYIW